MGPVSPQDEEAGPWLFMVYLDAANNLESAGIQDLHEILEGIKGAKDIKVIVLMDRIDGYSTEDGDWKDTRLFYFDGNTTQITRIAGMGLGSSGDGDELNMGDPATLQAFITFCKTTYPDQKKYLLDIWNHGGGWKNPEDENFNDIRKPICWDDESGHDTLYMKEFRDAIVGANVQFDIIYMDACLMQMVEVAYEIKNYCHYLVASEETVPGNGGDYVDILTKYKNIYNQGTHTPYRFSYEIISSYRNQYYSTGDTTLSSIDLTELNSLISALDTFGQNLMNVNSDTLKNIRNETKNFTYEDQADLYHFAQLCNQNISGGVPGASSVMNAIDKLMVKEYHYSGLPNCHGIAIYLPKDTSKVDAGYYNNSYDLQFTDSDNKWIDFIKWWDGK